MYLRKFYILLINHFFKDSPRQLLLLSAPDIILLWIHQRPLVLTSHRGQVHGLQHPPSFVASFRINFQPVLTHS